MAALTLARDVWPLDGGPQRSGGVRDLSRLRRVQRHCQVHAHQANREGSWSSAIFKADDTLENNQAVPSGVDANFNQNIPYWQILENSSRIFSEIFIFRVVTQAVLLENSSIRFF
mgnify:CR=1 FL=1